MTSYIFHVYYITRGNNKYDVDITAIPNTPENIKSAKGAYGGIEGTTKVMATTITSNEVSFVLPKLANGWELTSKPQSLSLPKSMIEDYEPGKPVPHITLHLKLKDTSHPTIFMDRIQITGVEPPHCVLTLYREPTEIIVPEEEKPPQYKTLENLKEEIARSLLDGADKYLLTQFKLKGWLIGPGPDPDVPGMINVALGRIKSNISNYDDFIGMLQEIPQAKNILETIMGMCPSTPSSISDEEEQKLLEEAMKEGWIDAGEGLLILLGVTGSGKTEFKRIVLRKKVPKHSPSTPLATRPVSVCNIKVDGVEWKEMGPKEMLEMVAKKMNQRRQQSVNTTGDAPQQNDHVAEHEETGPKENLEGDKNVHIEDQENSVGLGQEFDDALQQLDLKLIQTMRESISGDMEPQLLMGVDFIYILDSGGQPPFREMLPHFVQHASAIVLLQKLNERLDHKPTIKYREEGGKVDKGYTSQLTNEQILHQYVQAVQSHKSKVFVIGTHRDKEGECEGETREDKNEKLRKAFGEVLKGQLMLYDSGNLMFPLNCRSRKKSDKQVAKEFKERAMNEIKHQPKKQIPLPWFILKPLLQLLAQNLGKSVLSVKECCEAAKRKLHMSEESCQAALNHLGRLNIIFYRPELLPGVVFSNVQVVIDKITELVRCNHALRPKETEEVNETHGTNTFQESDENSEAEETSEESSESSESESYSSTMADPIPNAMKTDRGLEFRDFGKVNSDLLEKAFSSHYREGLFTASNLLLLLERMLIAGRLNSGEHFIPSLLPDLPVEKIAEHRATADHPPPLVIYYPKMWLPVGVMSSLVVYLQNECGWVLAEKKGTPTCMKHNCIEFELLDDEPGIIVIIDSIKYLEIHVKPSDELDSTPELLLHRISDNIMTGLHAAHKSLHYDPPQIEFGFLCPGNCGNKELHHATLVGDNKKWKCSEDKRIRGELDDGQKLWLQADSANRTQTSSSLSIDSSTAALLTQSKAILDSANRTRTSSSLSVDSSTADLLTQSKAILKEKPTRKKLMLVEYTEGTEEKREFRTLDKISLHWRDVADYLEISEAVISNAKRAGDQRESAREIMVHWIQSNTKASWSKLIKAMNSVRELKVAAEELRTALLNAVSDSDDDSDEDD